MALDGAGKLVAGDTVVIPVFCLNLFLGLVDAYPNIQPIEMPKIPQAETQTWNDSVMWYVPNRLSQWTVSEDCFRLEPADLGISVEQWMSFENSFKQSISERFHHEKLMVSIDIDWMEEGFCIRHQGLLETVQNSRNAHLHEMVDWTLVPVTLTEPSKTLNVVHQDHLKRVESGYASSFRWRVLNFRRRWLNGLSKSRSIEMVAVLQQASHRLVLYGQKPPREEDWSLDEIFPELDSVTHKRFVHKNQSLLKLTNVHPFQSGCSIHSDYAFPQVAVSIDVRFLERSRLELKALNSLLGVGARSWLADSLREEKGLVYTIGSEYRGDLLRISYTIDPSRLGESLLAVDEVLQWVSTHTVTEEDWLKMRSIYLSRQFLMLEDPAILVRLLGRYSDPLGWQHSLERTLESIDDLKNKNVGSYQSRLFLTGPVEQRVYRQFPAYCS